MNISEFLNQIQPDITLGPVLLVFAVATYKVTVSLWRLEQKFSSELIERIAELSGQFKSQFIEPMLIHRAKMWVNAAYDETLKLIETKVFSTDQEQRRYIGTEEIFKTSKIDEYKEELVANDKIQAFFKSAEGTSILDELDEQYLRSRDFVSSYDKCISSLRNAWILSASITILLLLGLISFLIDLPSPLQYFWLFSVIWLALLNIIFFSLSEYHRRTINSIWRKYQIHGKL